MDSSIETAPRLCPLFFPNFTWPLQLLKLGSNVMVICPAPEAYPILATKAFP
jgi:hypothetical protein